MNRYVVWSTHINAAEVSTNKVEVSRSVRAVAEQDAAIIRDILHRPAWVQDTEEKS
jgi:hypothetical protein